METSTTHTDIGARKAYLDSITGELKRKFIGLDEIIDEVMPLVSAWHIFPEAQLRPCVINLWGLTGSGKSALVSTLVELLEYKKLYAHFDMGEFDSNSANWLKRTFTEDLAHFHMEQPIICLDEFQFAKTISNGTEIGKDKLRVVWELIDSGKVLHAPDANQYYVKKALTCIQYLELFVKNGGEIRDGLVTSRLDMFLELFDSFFFDNDGRHDKPLDAQYLVSDDFINGLLVLDNSLTSKDSIVRRIRSTSLLEVIAYITKLVRTAVTIKELDLSRALIFVIGNLDEAYRMSSDLNPDVSADDMHEATSKITIATIKNALTRRFRSEQVARLGNNHFLYKAFSSEQFMELIRRELQRISLVVKDKFGWTIVVDDSVLSMIYSEGVIPSQGTRPVFTTINNLIQTRISKIALHVMNLPESQALAIDWSFKNDEFTFVLKDESQKVISTFRDRVHLQMDIHRRPLNPQLQSHTAVHESGHAVLAALCYRIVPSIVVSRSVSHDAEGFCQIRHPEGPFTRETLKKNIIVTLGGYVAEKMVFGEQFTCSGVGSDISHASMLANDAIRRYAMGSDPIRLAAVRSADTEDYFFQTSIYEKEAVKLITDCMEIAELILSQNKLLLLKMSEYLTYHSKMEAKLIEEFVKSYSTEDWAKEGKFIQPEAYFRFDKVVESQLAELVRLGELVDAV
jgi:hypothetical protein